MRHQIISGLTFSCVSADIGAHPTSPQTRCDATPSTYIHQTFSYVHTIISPELLQQTMAAFLAALGTEIEDAYEGQPSPSHTLTLTISIPER